MDQGRTSTIKPESKTTKYLRVDIDRPYVLRKSGERHSAILNISWMHEYEDWKTI